MATGRQSARNSKSHHNYIQFYNLRENSGNDANSTAAKRFKMFSLASKKSKAPLSENLLHFTHLTLKKEE